MTSEAHTIPDDIMQAARNVASRLRPEARNAILAGGNDDLYFVDIIAKAIHDAVMAERAWRPISTAPKTGETFIVRLANGEVFSATWHVYGSNPGWHVSSDIGFVNPSHWMPYPAAPKAEG